MLKYTLYIFRIQSRLNPVPESLNSPDIVPGTDRYLPGSKIDIYLSSYLVDIY